MGKQAQNIINHIVLALDASSSMSGHAGSVVKVADGLVKHLAERSQQQKQETRITVYTFSQTVECVIYDMDVLRLPSIATLYKAQGNTALIDASLLAMRDLALTPEKYGDHAFLLYVITDGEENSSRESAPTLRSHIQQLPGNWTIGALVPNITGVAEAKRFGFPAGNIQMWDTTSRTGVEDVGVAVAAATDTYMTSRSTGTRSTQNLFGGGQVLNKATVAAANLKPLDPAAYHLVPIVGIAEKTWISTYINDTLGLRFRLGRNFYQLSKPEKIQPQKDLAIMEKKTKKIFLGREARNLLDLPDMEVKVKPDFNPDYTIFVQSNSTNRHLVEHTQLLILK